MILFETERTFVRHMDRSDLVGFTELETNPNVVKYTNYPVASPKLAKKDLEVILANYALNPPEKWIYTVVSKLDASFLGTVALVPYKGSTWEIGYRFLEKNWGKGYASELVPALIQYGLSLPFIEEIYAEADVLNTPSIRILDRHMTFVKEVYNEKLDCTDRQYIKSLDT